jgi:hypothetical protein
MPTRPDIRDLAANVREAFADSDRETLLDILTFVVKEYVVEGPPPMLMHQAETIAELGGMSFAQLVTALQTRLDLPELALFAVDGEQVSVRIGGVMHPLQPGRTPPAAELPRPQAGVRVVETNVMQRPAAPPQPERAAPPPSRGLAVRGAPTGGVGGDAPPPAPAQPSPPAAPGVQPAPAATPAGNDKKDEPGGDDAAARFSLLELD